MYVLVDTCHKYDENGIHCMFVIPLKSFTAIKGIEIGLYIKKIYFSYLRKDVLGTLGYLLPSVASHF